MPLTQYETFIESAPDAMVVVRHDGTIVLINRQAEALFGYRQDELVGEPIEILVPERYREAHAGYRSAFTASPSTRSMGAGLELYGRRRDGSDFRVQISLCPLEAGGETYVSSAIRDISDRLRMEEQLAQAQAELERRRVRERQAVEINDAIVQGLVVAKYALDTHSDDKTREAVEETLRRARDIVTELLTETGERISLAPGDLRHALTTPASPDASPEQKAVE